MALRELGCEDTR